MSPIYVSETLVYLDPTLMVKTDNNSYTKPHLVHLRDFVSKEFTYNNTTIVD